MLEDWLPDPDAPSFFGQRYQDMNPVRLRADPERTGWRRWLFKLGRHIDRIGRRVEDVGRHIQNLGGSLQ